MPNGATEPDTPVEQRRRSIESARDLIAELRAGHPQHGDTPDDDLDIGQRQMTHLWALNLQSCLAGCVPSILEELDQLDELRPIPEEEATSVKYPGEFDPETGVWSGSQPWTWAEPIAAGSSDSRNWRDWPDWDPRHGHYENRVARSAIENLYRCGYALVKVDHR